MLWEPILFHFPFLHPCVSVLFEVTAVLCKKKGYTNTQFVRNCWISLAAFLYPERAFPDICDRDCKKGRPNPLAFNAKLASDLWDKSAKLVGVQSWDPFTAWDTTSGILGEDSRVSRQLWLSIQYIDMSGTVYCRVMKDKTLWGETLGHTVITGNKITASEMVHFRFPTILSWMFQNCLWYV